MKGSDMLVYMFPGQGAQSLGMGASLFSQFPNELGIAREILGYSIEDLCLTDANNQLSLTEFTQPALYVVNALHYFHYKKEGYKEPDFLLGHSLGEYNALMASGAFDFATGLELVQQRGILMGRATSGAMAAVIGLNSDEVARIIHDNQLKNVSIANYNSGLQQVIAGPYDEIHALNGLFMGQGAKLYIPLAVNGAFHSPLMQPALFEFQQFISDYTFKPLSIPVIANSNAKPYMHEEIGTRLGLHITSPVMWFQSIQMLLNHEPIDFIELGPGNVLARIVSAIRAGR